MIKTKYYLKQNSKIYSSQIGYYNFFYPDKDKSSFSNIKKEISTLSTWISPSGLMPFYFLNGESKKVIYWTEKVNIVGVTDNG